MRRAAGQAGRSLNRLLRLVGGLTVAAGLGLVALAWRLEQGPLSVPWLAEQVARVLNAGGGPTHFVIDDVAIAWAGWREGHRSPLQLTLEGIRAVDKDGGVHAQLPNAALSISLPWLLRGVVAPRALELRGLELRAERAADGAFRLDLGALGSARATSAEGRAEPDDGETALETLAELMRPPSEDTPLAALQELRLVAARLTVADAQIDRAWSADIASLSLIRREGGGIDLVGGGAISLGVERVPLRIGGSLSGQSFRGDASLSLPSVRPAALAAAAPSLAALAAIDAPASLLFVVRLDGVRVPAEAAARINVGAGVIRLGDRGAVPIRGLEVEAAFGDGRLHVARAVLRPAAPPRAAAEPPLITAEADAWPEDGLWHVEANIAVDQVAFSDLAHYWPEGIARGARQWITHNLTAGIAREGAWRVALTADPANGHVQISALDGQVAAEDVEVHWLRPVPPAERAGGIARFRRDAIELAIAGGRQAGTGLVVREGTVRFLFDTEPESAEMSFVVDGPLADAWTILRHPRLKLFERRPPPVQSLSGTLRDARLQITMPLIDELPVERLRISATGRATEVRIPRAMLARDLERGAFDFAADTDGLRVTGTGTVAGIALRIQQEADFRPGPPGQIVGRDMVTGRAEASQIASLGIDPRPFVEGPVGLDLRGETRRNGQSRVQLRTDFTPSRLAIGALSWAKPAGVTSAGEAMLVLQNGTLQRIEAIRVTTPDAMLRAVATDARDNLPQRIEIQQGQLGRSRMTGEIFPPRPGSPGWQISLQGSVLDLAPVLSAPPEAAEGAPREEGTEGVAIEARFERMLLREDRALEGVTASARVDGLGVVHGAEVRGRVASGGPFEMTIRPEGTRRRLQLTSADGGALLRAFGVLRTVQGGRLTVDATYAHSRPGAPLAGTAELEEFSVRDAPALAKLLQAMTVYGVFEALSAQGLTFASLTAPFTLTREALVLDDARAFSVSLGLTARGRIDRIRDMIDMEGTIVPAYVFNSLLGRIPLLGRIFSPERGGGLFAATYRMRGPLADPSVAVNPLAALTPGFLRGVFGIGQEGAPTGTPPPAR